LCSCLWRIVVFGVLLWGFVGGQLFWLVVVVFRGVSSLSLDDKGRVIIPARYRALVAGQCQGHLVATIDTEEPCLLVYPVDAWNEIQNQIESLPSFHPLARRIQRLLIGHATDLEVDTSGRVLVPTFLRSYAGLSRKVIFLGQGKKFELWDEERWSKRRAAYIDDVKDTDAVPETLQQLSL